MDAIIKPTAQIFDAVAALQAQRQAAEKVAQSEAAKALKATSDAAVVADAATDGTGGDGAADSVGAPGNSDGGAGEPETGDADAVSEDQGEDASDADQSADSDPAAAPVVELFTVKLDGKEFQVTREELVKGYQVQKNADKKAGIANEEIRKARADQDKVASERQQAIGATEQALQILQAQRMQDSNTNWDQLASDNPAEWVKRANEARKREATFQALAAQHTSLSQQQMASLAASRTESLVDSVPEWSEPTKRTADLNAIESYMRKMGYQDAQIVRATAADVLLVRKAMELDRVTEAASKALPKPVKVPPQTIGAKGQTITQRTVLKSGTTAANQGGPTRAERDARAALNKSKGLTEGVSAAVALLRARRASAK